MPRFLQITLLVATMAVGLLPGRAGAAIGLPVTVDFSTHGHGPLQPDSYKRDGVVFTEGSFVGFIQGDDALVGPVAGRFTPPVSSLSARLAPAVQGTAEYTLRAFDASGDVVASASVTVTQDTGDPASGPFGYFTIDLGTLPRGAKWFELNNRFVRSSFPHITSIQFGVSDLTYASPSTANKP